MGAKSKNVEAVTDYADGRSFVRLHRDILLPTPACESVRRLLAANRNGSEWESCCASGISLQRALFSVSKSVAVARCLGRRVA
jgi:hypothetical protein